MSEEQRTPLDEWSRVTDERALPRDPDDAWESIGDVMARVAARIAEKFA